MSWYRAGTVTVTNGSKTVTGVGTLFTTAVNAGDAFALVDANLNPTGAWYEVESVTNNTTLVLKQSYAGSTGSNKQYCVFNLVGNMTTPSFAQRLATFFASFQSLIDKPTTTPTAASIPVADANGKIDSGWIPATFFNKTNILGTVSQVGGVPTGAVIERGTNANGTYVKFADGTLICYGSHSFTCPSLGPHGSLHIAASYVSPGLFPIAFLSTPRVSLGASCANQRIWATQPNPNTTTFAFDIFAASANAAGNSAGVHFIAIGRWY
jgi:hypothetical protein